VDDEATDTASTPPSIDVATSEIIGRRDTVLAIRWIANVTLQPMKPLGDRFTTTSSPKNRNRRDGDSVDFTSCLRGGASYRASPTPNYAQGPNDHSLHFGRVRK